jgi:hypothetical protein
VGADSIENKPQFLEVNGDIMEDVDPAFYGHPKAAAFKTSGMNFRDSLVCIEGFFAPVISVNIARVSR